MSVSIKRDGETLAVVANQDDAFFWLLNHQTQSVHWALLWGGYILESDEDNES